MLAYHCNTPESVAAVTCDAYRGVSFKARVRTSGRCSGLDSEINYAAEPERLGLSSNGNEEDSTLIPSVAVNKGIRTSEPWDSWENVFGSCGNLPQGKRFRARLVL